MLPIGAAPAQRAGIPKPRPTAWVVVGCSSRALKGREKDAGRDAPFTLTEEEIAIVEGAYAWQDELPPLQGCSAGGAAHPGLRPGLWCFGPSGLRWRHSRV